MAKLTYYEKLRDPRWQKKRLEVMQENNFSCELCGDSTTTLNVHHKEYFKDWEPWNYTNSQLACLCEPCHENQHSNLDMLKLACSVLNIEERIEVAALIAGYLGENLSTFIKLSGAQYYPYLDVIYESGVMAKNASKEALSKRGFVK